MNTDAMISNELEIFMHLNEEKPPVKDENVNNVEEFHVNEHTFKMAKARGKEIIVMEDGRINLTKLCQMFGEKPFRQIRTNKVFRSMVLDIENSQLARNENNTDFMTVGIPTVMNEGKNWSLDDYEELEKTIFYEAPHGKALSIVGMVSGVYGPRYLVDWLIMIENPAYYILVHELLESIDEETANEIRVGIFDFIKPVITSVEGL